MSKLVLLFICLEIFQHANALQCYYCTRDGCEDDVNWQKAHCGKTVSAKMETACLKHIFKDFGETITSRKCVLKFKDEPYQCNPVVGEELFCETCDSDVCNSATSVITACGVFFLLLLPKFLA